MTSEAYIISKYEIFKIIKVGNIGMNLEGQGLIRGESANEYASRILKLNILNLTLAPGQLISENEVAEMLNISRTPVREAFIRLAHNNLLEIYPQKGTYVSKINLDYVEEGWFARITLEAAIVKLVCDDYFSEGLVKDLEENLHMQEYYAEKKDLFKFLAMDEAFHRSLYKACRKERTCLVIESLNYDYYRTRALTTGIKLEKTLAQHTGIKNAIKDRDGIKASKMMEEHLSSLKLDLEILKVQHPEFIK